MQGPVDIVEQGVNGYMDYNLETAVKKCLTLDRKAVKKASQGWTWDSAWQIFRENLIDK